MNNFFIVNNFSKIKQSNQNKWYLNKRQKFIKITEKVSKWLATVRLSPLDVGATITLVMEECGSSALNFLVVFFRIAIIFETITRLFLRIYKSFMFFFKF